jgi:hypothetical protein
MTTSRGPFPFANRYVNPLVTAVARSPLGKFTGSSTALLTVTGRSSGKQFTFPVSVKGKGATTTISVMAPARKIWWRNLTGDGGQVSLEVGGVVRTGHAVASGDENSGVKVEVTFD